MAVYILQGEEILQIAQLLLGILGFAPSIG